MSDVSVGRNESPEKIKFLFLSNNRVSVFTQDEHWIFNQNIAREDFYSQVNYEFILILSDTKNGKSRGRFDNHGWKNRIMFLANSVHVDAK